MKWQFKWALNVVCIISLCVLAACSHQASNGPIQVQIPWPHGRGHYALTPITLKTVTDINSLSGPVADMRIQPGITSGSLSGPHFEGQFIRDANGVYIPLDQSLEAATVYAHLERLHDLDQRLGVAGLGQWPREVGLQTRLTDVSSEAQVNNAFYVGFCNALLILPFFTPRNMSASVPFGLNAGILAHEHFHSLFEFIVLRHLTGPDSEALMAATNSQMLNLPSRLTNALYNGYLLRGVNEGLADFWGWVYSGDPEFFYPSLKGPLTDGRVLDGPMTKFASSSLMVQTINIRIYGADKGIGYAYQMGSQVSHALFQVYKAIHGDSVMHEDMQTGLDQRLAMARIVLKSLPQIAEVFGQNYEDKVLSVSDVMKPLFAQLPADQKVCDVMKEASSVAAKENSKCK